MELLLQQLGGGWELVDGHHLEKEFFFKNFVDALNFTNQLGEIAELKGEHPDIYLTWGRVKIQIWTHIVD